MKKAKALSTRQDSLQKAMASTGRSLLLKHFDGKRLTRGQALIAKCCECSGYYADGRVDCQMPDCPLYPYMPYGKGDFAWESETEPEVVT